MDPIPNGLFPERTSFRMDTIPNEQWTPSRMDTNTNGHNPECALICKYSYLSFVNFQRRFELEINFLRNVSPL